jgi:hypothetical protein
VPGAGAAADDEAVFEFEESEGTYILPAVGTIRDNGEELPALSGIAVPDELRLRVEAIEDSEVVAVGWCGVGDISEKPMDII